MTKREILSSERSNEASDLCGFIEAKISKRSLARLRKFKLETEQIQSFIKDEIKMTTKIQYKELENLADMYENEMKKLQEQKAQVIASLNTLQQSFTDTISRSIENLSRIVNRIVGIDNLALDHLPLKNQTNDVIFNSVESRKEFELSSENNLMFSDDELQIMPLKHASFYSQSPKTMFLKNNELRI